MNATFKKMSELIKADYWADNRADNQADNRADNQADNQADNLADNLTDNWADVNEKKLCLHKRKKKMQTIKRCE